VLEQLELLTRAAAAVRALGEDRLLGLDGRRGARRALGGRLGRRRAVLVLDRVRGRREHLRDDVAGAQHDDLVARPHVLATEVLLVVQRRHLHGHAADLDGLELGERVQVAELADAPLHVLQRRHLRRRRELPGDRPARVAPDRAQPALQLEVVDLHDDAVDLEVQRAAAALPLLALADDRVGVVEDPDVAVDAEPVLAQPVQPLRVLREAQPVDAPQAVRPHRQRAIARELGIELADRARRRVARVHERRQAGLGAPLVEPCEVRQRHVDLTADLEHRRRVLHPHRDRADRAQVVGHVLADLTVAARRAPDEHALVVEQRDRQPVDLRLADVAERRLLDPLAGEVAAHPLHPGQQLLGRARVGQREHRLLVPDLLEHRDRLGADPLGRRVGGREIRVLLLELLELAEQRVVLVVADLGVVEDVVAATVVLELLAQLLDAAPDVLARRHSTSSAAGSTSRDRSWRSSASIPVVSVRSKCKGVTDMRPFATAARSVPGSSS
jgi:hypothetical protein